MLKNCLSFNCQTINKKDQDRYKISDLKISIIIYDKFYNINLKFYNKFLLTLFLLIS